MSSQARAIKPIRSLLAVALAAAAVPAMAAGPYTQTVFFGDSLTDAGFFRPLLPASVRPVTTLRAMYADGVAAMRALRAEVDPSGALGSPFLDRLLAQRGAKNAAR